MASIPASYYIHPNEMRLLQQIAKMSTSTNQDNMSIRRGSRLLDQLLDERGDLNSMAKGVFLILSAFPPRLNMFSDPENPIISFASRHLEEWKIEFAPGIARLCACIDDKYYVSEYKILDSDGDRVLLAHAIVSHWWKSIRLPCFPHTDPRRLCLPLRLSTRIAAREGTRPRSRLSVCESVDDIKGDEATSSTSEDKEEAEPITIPEAVTSAGDED